jgi:hypothetical protein
MGNTLLSRNYPTNLLGNISLLRQSDFSDICRSALPLFEKRKEVFLFFFCLFPELSVPLHHK